MRIACLHTAKSNVAVFEHAARQLGIPEGVLSHHVRDDLLAAAEMVHGLNSQLEGETSDALR